MADQPKRLFKCGEIDPAFRAQLEGEVYQTGLKTLRNATVKKMGGVRNRPGTRFVSSVQNQYSAQRLLEFDYADGFNDSFAVLFGAGNTRFIKNSIPVRLSPIPITGITQANPGVFTCEAFPFPLGSTIFIDGEEGMTQINNQSYLVIPLTDDTFKLTDLLGNNINTENFTAFSGGATATQLYEIANPFVNSELPYLNYDQSFDQLKIASGTKPLQDLNYLADDNWTLTNSLFEPSIAAPVNLAASVAGNDSTYAVTALKIGTGEESLAAVVLGATGSQGTPQTLTWNPVPEGFFYEVYRADSSGAFGLIGVAGASENPTFTDTNSPGPNTAISPPGVVGTLFDFGFFLKQQPDTSFPDTELPGNGTCIAWSPDGTLVAVGNSVGPYLQIYQYQSGGFTLLGSPTPAPINTVNALAWSPDGSYLAVGASTNTELFALMYKRNGFAPSTWTLNTTGFANPVSQVNGISWSSDSSMIAFATSDTPYFYCYQRSLDTFTKVANPATLPTDQGNCCVFLNGSKSAVFPLPTFSPALPVTFEGVIQYPEGDNYAGLPITTGVLIVGHNYSGGRSLTSYAIAPTQTAGEAINLIPLDAFGDDPSCDVLSLSCPSGVTKEPLVTQWGIYDVIPQQIVTVGFEDTPFVRTYIINGLPSFQYFFDVAIFVGIPVGYLVWLNWNQWNTAPAPDPETLPTGPVNAIAETPDGSYCVLATDAAAGQKNLLLYDRIANVLVLDPNQPSPDITGPGTGASFSPDSSLLGVTQSANAPFAWMYGSSIIHPACVGFGQQRLRIANIPTNEGEQNTSGPGTEFDSAEDAYTNFAIRALPVASDPIQFTTWTRKYNAIKHLLSLKKLMQLTTNGIIVLEGDQNGTISPGLQSPRVTGYNGANYVRPAYVGNSAIYVGKAGNTLYDLKKEATASSFFSSDNFFPTDLTITAAHRLRGCKITWACYQEKPDSIVWFGITNPATGKSFMGSMTYNIDQQIIGFGFHDMGDMGNILDGCCVCESDGTDRVYLVVDIGTSLNPNKMVVSMADREKTGIEDQYFVDCGVTYDGRNTTTATVSATVAGDYFIVSSNSPVFPDEGLGMVVRIYNTDGGYADFHYYAGLSNFAFEATLGTLKDPTGLGFATPTTQWSVLTQSVNGLSHLNGMLVSVFADGQTVSSPNNPFFKNVLGYLVDDPIVENGIVDLSGFGGFWYEVVHVGLPFTTDIQTLDYDVAQGPSVVEITKNAPRVVVKVDNTKGLFFANGELQPVDDTAKGFQKGFFGNRQPTFDVQGGPLVNLIQESIEAPVDGKWSHLGRVFIRQVDPCPVEIVGIFNPTSMT